LTRKRELTNGEFARHVRERKPTRVVRRRGNGRPFSNEARRGRGKADHDRGGDLGRPWIKRKARTATGVYIPLQRRKVRAAEAGRKFFKLRGSRVIFMHKKKKPAWRRMAGRLSL